MYDYTNKLKGNDGRNSVYQILSQKTFADWEIAKTEYDATRISYIKIDGNTFSNYGQYQFIWEKTYVKSPSRSASGNIGNLNSYATFLTPHLIINFSLMSIDDYRAIMRLHYEKNEFIVECYDIIYNKPIKIKMYFGTEQMVKLYTINQKRLGSNNDWEDWIEVVGVQDYSVELIGTNNEIDLVSVTYHLNPPKSTGVADYTIGEPDVYNGEEIVIGSAASSITTETFGGVYKFKNWNLSKEPEEQNKGVYINGNVYTINLNDSQKALVLYAQWESIESHILSYSYGISDALIDEETASYITSKSVVKGQSIGKLPYVTPPKVKHKDLSGEEKEYSPYYNGQWYKTPIKAQNSDAIVDNTLYWANRDSIIYLIFDTYTYDLVLNLKNPSNDNFEIYQQNLNSQNKGIEYNSLLNLPIPVKEGYNFDGWYYTPDFKEGTKVSVKMPPYSLDVYGRWVSK